jgi:YggT family protein
LIVDIVNATVMVLTILIILRALMTWVPNLNPMNPIVQFLVQTTEPILAPLRAVMPRGMMIDFTPMIAIIILQVVGAALVRNLG